MESEAVGGEGARRAMQAESVYLVLALVAGTGAASVVAGLGAF